MAQQASLFSPLFKISINGAAKFASKTALIWFAFPAVMLLIVQQASFRIVLWGGI